MHILLSLILAVAPTAHAWTLNDVSILLPLPKSAGEIRELLGTGDLLPIDIYKNLPRLIMGGDPQNIFDNQLKVVAIRIDPCFREGTGTQACRRQIRMVWQPVMTSQSGGSPFTADAAMHTFYDLDEEDWNAMLAELAPLAGHDESESLNIHPRIRQEGLRGPHWQKLKAILTKYAGKHSLTRATMMNVDPLGSLWMFTGVDVSLTGVMTRVKIPRAHHIVQGVFADVGNLNEIRMQLRPMPETDLSWWEFVTDSSAAEHKIGRDGILQAMEQAVRIENPLRENAGTVDCASCHIAQNIRLWGERNLKNWVWQAESDAYKRDPASVADLRNNSVQPGFVNRLRAFGYFFEEPIIAQRVIHESAEVLKSIQTTKRGILCSEFL